MSQSHLKFYVKNENKWDKDNDNKMGQAIHEVAMKQIKKIKDWEIKHPNYLEDENLLHEWQEFIRNTMGGLTAEDHEKDIKKWRNVELFFLHINNFCANTYTYMRL